MINKLIMFDFMCSVMSFLNHKDYNKHFSQLEKQTSMCPVARLHVFGARENWKPEWMKAREKSESFVSSRDSRRASTHLVPNLAPRRDR